MTNKPAALGFQIDLEMLVFEERGKMKYPEKNLSEQFDTKSRNRTRATLVVGLCGRQMHNHCAIPGKGGHFVYALHPLTVGCMSRRGHVLDIMAEIKTLFVIIWEYNKTVDLR